MWCDIPVSSAQQVGFSILVPAGSGIGKLTVSGSGSGWVGVLKYTIEFFRVFFLLSGIPG